MTWIDTSYVKYWAWLFLPGHFIFYCWIYVGVLLSLSLGNIEVSLERQWGLFFAGCFVTLGGLWFLLGTYHVMWIDIKKHFIPYRLSLVGNQVAVKGLYLKTDTFTREMIKSLTHFEVYTHWYKRVHTLFLPNIEHYKLSLTDGRSYHFHGSSTDVRAMLVQLTGITSIPLADE